MRRKIADVFSPEEVFPLQRVPLEDYVRVATGIAQNVDGTNLIQADLGSGKSTRQMCVLAKVLKRTVAITLPSVALALQILDSLTEAVDVMNELYEPDYQIVVGRRIDKIVTNGNIIVQTPAYVDPADFNVFDEFQNVTCFNVKFFESMSNYRGLLLMSATPYTALYAAIVAAGIEVREFNLRVNRQTKRFFVQATKLPKNF
jgi:hypothetical protein